MQDDQGYGLYAETRRAAPQNRGTGGRGGKAATLIIGIAVAACVLGGGAYWFYHQGPVLSADGKLPIILPDPLPIKLRPDDPGGMEVPHRDTTIYQQLSDDPQDTNVVLQELPEMPKMPEIAPSDAESGEIGEDVITKKAPIGVATANASPQATSSQGANPQGTNAATGAGNAAVPGNSASATPVTPPAATGGEEYRIQLVSVRDETAAQSEWKRISSKNKDLLGNLQMQVKSADLGDKGMYYRLQAGPLPSAAAAEQLCDSLKQRNVGCMIVRP